MQNSPILYSCHLFNSFAPQYPYLHINLLHSSTIIFLLYCFIVTISPLWPIYCLYLPYLTSFTHTVHRLFYRVIDCMFVCSMCNSVLLFVSHCLALSWPGRSCKWELVLNWPTWLNKGERKIKKESCPRMGPQCLLTPPVSASSIYAAVVYVSGG